ncbi:MAG TPA: 30S ribosomal protein S4 [Thermotogota bacterium]|jgi:small subunit ribosomal protein S4|nr:30S ribosomal protein S4 [Thermotogota bacterium]OQC31702.1 MAG: 30S ribosomal protein S4 [Thermotogota bacterium ADurb.Bin062]HNW46178.1 30S ribosomal protein S4 [Thermotogota bacterium]HNY82993.1 30S ribosomal protein S4 [Thermotogota bacterium]HOD91006.1 30S ribosomal protein S4 [Thermotogota bacterium]
MARYTGPVCRLCRREGKKLYLKGDRCFSTAKCAFEKRPYIPGQHGKSNPKKLTQYGAQLRAKQSMKRIYGVLESQFANYFEEARRRKGVTGEILVKLVESRLDNVVYRMGFAVSRDQARQLVNHGHFKVNGKKVDIPSFLLRVNDVVELSERSRSIKPIQNAIEAAKTRGTPGWLDIDFDGFKATLLRLPNLEETQLPLDVQSIVELYSK